MRSQYSNTGQEGRVVQVKLNATGLEFGPQRLRASSGSPTVEVATQGTPTAPLTQEVVEVLNQANSASS